MRGPEDRRRAAEITPQELGLIAKVASAFRTTDREELQAELACRLLDLKHKPTGHVRNWEAYLAKFLYNKASTWVQAQRKRESRTRSFDAPDPDNPDQPPAEPPEEGGPDALQPIAMDAVWRQLDPELRRFWQVLSEEEGNQSTAASRLGIHRNTARKWRARVLQVLQTHGFDAP